MRIPAHIGIIPDGNRRWAVSNGMSKEKGYATGLEPGLAVFKLCEQIGVKEITYYGFTTDNNKRPMTQRQAFTDACVNAVKLLSGENASLLVVGNNESKMFPEELSSYTTRRAFGKGGIKVNFLVNYGWEWDLGHLAAAGTGAYRKNIITGMKSNAISRIDLIIRWGGRRRLSGFLPVQSIYADFYVVDEYWPDFKPEHFYQALDWYDKQDITLGG
ncbi:undecaprenyl diphosphate synthase [Ruminiclostridium sufflavum DSM 19573]|uniref:Undecaprenyl diphosphate synthase n=1 Tax=Ruminiclostridium sufflavum DSM 19573 TaxID=1121337 RepID=A0A318XTW7_9FIRM|nr:undecaprenyl diphosphate synthase family protein [Ruminiclostridium sufflavum]PYG89929.1 undecaprenyl diphosphate synthase [Ruminiclostridium sufflavum DSM 19573]